MGPEHHITACHETTCHATVTRLQFIEVFADFNVLCLGAFPEMSLSRFSSPFLRNTQTMIIKTKAKGVEFMSFRT